MIKKRVTYYDMDRLFEATDGVFRFLAHIGACPYTQIGCL